MLELQEIRNFLKSKVKSQALASWRKFVPTSEKVYGVYLTDVNVLVRQYKSCGFSFVEALWQDAYIEERILAAKLLGKICKKDPEKSLKLVETFVKDIEDWAVCDTLGMQGIRPLLESERGALFEMSRRLVRSRNVWERRFALVILVNYAKKKEYHEDIEAVLKHVEGEKEYYAKKAVVWLRNELEKGKKDF